MDKEVAKILNDKGEFMIAGISILMLFSFLFIGIRLNEIICVLAQTLDEEDFVLFCLTKEKELYE